MSEQNSKQIEWDWSKNVDAEFLLSQERLTIFLKDGFSFFRANAENLTQRFRDHRKSTHIIICHPDSPHMAAIAAMDDEKKGKLQDQRNDCLSAVEELHQVRHRLLRGYGEDGSSVKFTGHAQVPTWNGFIGDNVAIINLYPTRPHHGPMPSLQAKSGDELYRWAARDVHSLYETTRSEDSMTSNLWDYMVPAGFKNLRFDGPK